MQLEQNKVGLIGQREPTLSELFLIIITALHL